MSRVEVLKESRQSISVKFLEFTRIVSKNKIAMVFEGEDAKYYSIRINSITPEMNWASIDCGGKRKVLELREAIRKHPEYYNAPCLFFVDSDFDDNTDIVSFSDTYITPCYSIENLYITERAFERILEAEFKLSSTNENAKEFDKALDAYRNLKIEYLEKITGFNYLIKEIRRLENEGVVTGKLHINDLSFKKLIKVSLNRIEKLYDEESPNLIFPKLEPNIDINLKYSETYFDNLSAELWFRGKQHLDFLRKFIVDLVNDRNAKENRRIFTTKGVVKLNLTNDNCISELSQYADTPPSLVDFLKQQNFTP